MSDYSPPPPTEPPGGFRPQPYASAPPPHPPAGPILAGRMGARLTRRPEPRFGISLAAAGAAIVIAGVLVWSFGYLADGLHIHFDNDTGVPSASGDGRRFLGAALSAVLVAAGYLAVIARRNGPLASAGVVASAFGVPLLLLFLTLDISDTLRGQLPFQIDAFYIVSILVWIVSYALVPGGQGRAVYLGLAALGVPSYIAIKASDHDLMTRAVMTANGGSPLSGNGGTGTVAAIGLIFGLGYYAIAAFLDSRGRTGAAVALAVAGFFVTVTGVIAAAPDFHQAGIGVLLIVLGAGLAWYGGHFGRRFTSWAWAAAFVLGVFLVVDKIAPHSYTGAGIVLIVVGAAVAIGAQAYSSTTSEPSELEPSRVV